MIATLWRTARGALAVGLALGAGPLLAWSNHAVLTWPALSALPELNRAAPVKVESLATFLRAESAGLATLLADEEAWSRSHVAAYPARPGTLAWRDLAGTDAELVARFVAATRINPASKLGLFVQLRPDETAGERPVLPESAVTPLKSTESTKLATFVAVREGETVAAIDVIATASDEPDYGLDIGLWADSGSAQGAVYAMGKQPFGNPAIEFSSQTPMHVGFYHEADIVYRAAPFLVRCYPEYRIHLWRTLAAHAFRTGHAYWGWRFAGWGLHYAQDLSQPYHARVLPGFGTARMLGINALDIVGVHGPKDRAVTRVTNRHLALENFEVRWIRSATRAGTVADVGLQALRDASHDGAARYGDDWPRAVISHQASDAADAIDAALAAHLPARITDDATYTFGVSETGIDVYGELGVKAPGSRAALVAAIVPLLAHTGAQSRAYVRSLPGSAAAAAQTRPP